MIRVLETKLLVAFPDGTQMEITTPRRDGDRYADLAIEVELPGMSPIGTDSQKAIAFLEGASEYKFTITSPNAKFEVLE